MERFRSARAVLDVLASVAMLGTSVVIVWLLLTAPDAAPEARPSAAAVEDISNKGLAIPLDETSRLGADDAPLYLVEFSDYQCPFCRRYVENTFPQLKKRFIETGTVAYMHAHLPLTEAHPHARSAAIAADCAAEQGRFWDLHARLFTSPQDLTEAGLVAAGTAAGLDMLMFSQCRSAASRPRVERGVREADRLGVRSTPTFFLGVREPRTDMVRLARRINGAYPYEIFEREIAALSREKRIVE